MFATCSYCQLNCHATDNKAAGNSKKIVANTKTLVMLFLIILFVQNCLNTDLTRVISMAQKSIVRPG